MYVSKKRGTVRTILLCFILVSLLFTTAVFSQKSNHKLTTLEGSDYTVFDDGPLIENEVLKQVEQKEKVSVVIFLKEIKTSNAKVEEKITQLKQVAQQDQTDAELDVEQKKEKKKQIANEVLKLELVEQEEIIEKKQSEVLDKLEEKKESFFPFFTHSSDKQDFVLTYKYKTIPALAGEITASGLEKISRSKNVERITLDGKVSVHLTQSVPLINATPLHTVQLNGQNITGKGQTICVVDTGVDYTHDSLGDCTAPSSGTFVEANESHAVAADHDYNNNQNTTWTITKPGYDRTAVHFVNFTTENQFDFVYVKNATDHIVATYSGNLGDFWSPSVAGDTILVNLISDASVVDWGFAIDQVNNGTTTNDVAWSCDKVIGGYDFVNSDFDPKDDHNHGTHVAATAAGNGSTSGVAPGARIAAVKVLNSAGTGTVSAVAAGIDWCTYNAPDLNISVISISLGDSSSHTEHCSAKADALAVNRAHTAGLFVSVSTGNDADQSGITDPACAVGATAVGATYDANSGSLAYSSCTDIDNPEDNITCFTNRGLLLDLLAPGAHITAAVRGDTTSTLRGTSMAAPHVSGAAALLLHAWDRENSTVLDPDQIKRTLNSTGKQVEDGGRNYSRIDVFKAIRSLTLTVNDSEDIVDNNEAEISFIETVSTTNATECVLLADNLVSLHATDCLELNVSANVSIKHLPYTATPTIQKDGVTCDASDCTILSYASGLLRFNVTGFSNYSTIAAANTPPNTTNPTITDPVFEYSTAKCINGTSVDEDNDSISFNYTWFANENVVSNNQTIDGFHFDHFDNITCEIRACDTGNCSIGYNSSTVQINNSIPNATNVVILPSTINVSLQNITCNLTFNDGDNTYSTVDTDQGFFKWFNGSVVLTNQNTVFLNSSFFAKNHDLRCEYLPSDSFDNGTAVNSSVITVSNAIPETTTPSLSHTSISKNTESLLCLNETFTDADNDIANFTYKWFVDQTVIDINTNNLTNSSFTKNQNVTCEIASFDGTVNGTAFNSSVITVSNAIPSKPNSLQPLNGLFGGNNPLVNTSCSGSNDADADDLTYIIAAFYDEEWTNITNITADSFYWNVSTLSTQTNVSLRCQSFDGSNHSTFYNNSNDLEIDNTPPELNVSFPVNNSGHNTTALIINFTANETNLDQCWIVNTTGDTQTYTSCPVNVSFSEHIDQEGAYNISISTNDTLNNKNSSHIFFNIFHDEPAIANLTVGSITTSSAIISLNTGDQANVTLDYGTTTSLDTTTVNTEFAKQHSFTLSSLSSSTTYYYNVSACNKAGFCNETAVATFQTSAKSTSSSSSGGGGGSGGGGSTASTKTFKYIWPSVDANKEEEVALDKPGITLTGLNLTFKESLENPSLTIEGSVSKERVAEIITPVETKIYQYVFIEHPSFESEQVKDVVLQFRVLTTWMKVQNVTFEQLVVFRYNVQLESWVELPTKFLKRDQSYHYYQALSPGLSYYAVGVSLISEEDLVVAEAQDVNISDFLESEVKPQKKDGEKASPSPVKVPSTSEKDGVYAQLERVPVAVVVIISSAVTFLLTFFFILHKRRKVW